MNEISWTMILGATALGAVISAIVSAIVTSVNAWRERVHRSSEATQRLAWDKEMSAQRAAWEKELAKQRADAEASLQALRRGWDLEDQRRTTRQSLKSEAKKAVLKWTLAMKNGALNVNPEGSNLEAIAQANAGLQFLLPPNLEKLRLDYQALLAKWLINKQPIDMRDPETVFPPTNVSSAYDSFMLATSAWLQDSD